MNDDNAIRRMLESAYLKKDVSGLMNIIMDNCNGELIRKRSKALAFLYLKQAIEEGISIQEAVEKYGWQDEEIKVKYCACDGVEYGMSLIPRRNVLKDKIQYRSTALNILELIRRELGVLIDHENRCRYHF